MITGEEYEEALMKMKNGKSTREEGVAIELIKEGSERMKEIVFRFLNKC